MGLTYLPRDTESGGFLEVETRERSVAGASGAIVLVDRERKHSGECSQEKHSGLLEPCPFLLGSGQKLKVCWNSLGGGCWKSLLPTHMLFKGAAQWGYTDGSWVETPATQTWAPRFRSWNTHKKPHAAVTSVLWIHLLWEERWRPERHLAWSTAQQHKELPPQQGGRREHSQKSSSEFLMCDVHPGMCSHAHTK